jgi:hypothetical protein
MDEMKLVEDWMNGLIEWQDLPVNVQEAIDEAMIGYVDEVGEDDAASETVEEPFTAEIVKEAGKQLSDANVELLHKADNEHRFTLGPWYIPDRYDAHGEWTDADELQKSLWEYVKSGDRGIRLQHNKEVQLFFKNTKNDTVGTPKESLKHACLMKDSDTADMVLLRKLLFEFDAGHAQSLQAPVYGIPVHIHQSDTAFKPQVHIYFQERYPYVADRLRSCRGEISFVLMDETSANYSRAKAVALASAIKREMATPIFVWEKGKFYYYYRDKDRGYDLRLLVKSKAEGERITAPVKLTLTNLTKYKGKIYLRTLDINALYGKDFALWRTGSFQWDVMEFVAQSSLDGRKFRNV